MFFSWYCVTCSRGAVRLIVKFGACECCLDMDKKYQLFCQLLNWFNFFCMPRTFSNCMETVLTTIALYYWWPSSATRSRVGFLTSRQLGILSAGLSCVMRPTSLIIWLYVGIAHLLETITKRQYIFEEVLPIG